MRAVRIHRFGPPEVIVIDDIPKPTPNQGEVVIKVEAAGIGPWDALIRSGKSALPQRLPLILGSDVSGIIESKGTGVEAYEVNDEVFGVTNDRFIGAYAEYAVAKAGMIAPKPKTLNHTHSASVPVVAVTAWQMLFEYAKVSAGQSVLVHGGAGNVSAYAIQLAKHAGAMVIATASSNDIFYVRNLGADGVIDYRKNPFEQRVKEMDAVIDTVGGEILNRSIAVVRPGGILVSSANAPSDQKAAQSGIRAAFFMVKVTTERLREIAALIDTGQLLTEVGEVLWLEEARRGHEMLERASHKRGKIVIKVRPQS